MDRHAVTAVLERARELEITAILAYVDGREAALCGGYGLCGHIFDLSFAKQRENMAGLSAYARGGAAAHPPGALYLYQRGGGSGPGGPEEFKAEYAPNRNEPDV